MHRQATRDGRETETSDKKGDGRLIELVEEKVPNYVIFSINTIYRYIGLSPHFSLPSFESSKVNVKNVPAMWAEKYSHAEYSYQYVNLPESKQPLLPASYGHGVTGNSDFVIFF